MIKPHKSDEGLKFAIPTRIILGKNKKTSFPINVNTFANKHHRVKHNAKTIFYDYIQSLRLSDITHGAYENRVQLHYDYYRERGGLFDESNVGAALDKFTCDALVNCGVLRGDDYKRVKHYTFEFCGIEKPDWGRDDLHGYCEVTIKELKTYKPPAWWR